MYYKMDAAKLPKVHLADEAVLEPPHVHKKRIPGEWIFYLVKKGEMYLEENGILYHLKEGDLLLLEPDWCHEGKRTAYCEYFYIHFQHPDIVRTDADDKAMRQEMYQIRSAALKSAACCGQPGTKAYQILLPKLCRRKDEASYAALLRCLHSMLAVHCDHMEYYETLCACQFLQFLIQASRSCLSAELEKSGMTAARSYQKVLEVQNYLHASYHEQLTGDFLAEKFDMNFDYLNRLFRQNVGKPIFQYLCSLRIAHARELLTTTSMRIAQVSERTGFMDESYFSKVFKKYTGVCPADYAKTVLKEGGQNTRE